MAKWTAEKVKKEIEELEKKGTKTIDRLADVKMTIPNSSKVPVLSKNTTPTTSGGSANNNSVTSLYKNRNDRMAQRTEKYTSGSKVGELRSLQKEYENRKYSNDITEDEHRSYQTRINSLENDIQKTQKANGSKLYSDVNNKNDVMRSVNTWLVPNRKMTKDEQKQARELYHSIYGGNNASLGIDKVSENTGYSKDELLAINRAFAKQNDLQSAMLGFGSGEIALKNGLRKDENTDTLNQMKADAQKQNPLAFLGGQFAGNAVDYSIGNKVVDATPIGNALTNKMGEKASNIATGQIVDTVLDTIPELKENIYSGKYDNADGSFNYGKALADAGINQGINLAMNLGAEYIPTLLKRNNVEAPKMEETPEFETKEPPKFEFNTDDSDMPFGDLEKATREAQNAAQEVPDNAEVRKELFNTGAEQTKHAQEDFENLFKTTDEAAMEQPIETAPTQPIEQPKTRTANFTTFDTVTSKYAEQLAENGIDYESFRKSVEDAYEIAKTRKLTDEEWSNLINQASAVDNGMNNILKGSSRLVVDEEAVALARKTMSDNYKALKKPAFRKSVYVDKEILNAMGLGTKKKFDNFNKWFGIELTKSPTTKNAISAEIYLSKLPDELKQTLGLTGDIPSDMKKVGDYAVEAFTKTKGKKAKYEDFGQVKYIPFEEDAKALRQDIFDAWEEIAELEKQHVDVPTQPTKVMAEDIGLGNSTPEPSDFEETVNDIAKRFPGMDSDEMTLEVNKKLSKVYDNTARNSGVVGKRDMKSKLPKELFEYAQVSEKESLWTAIDEIANQGEKEALADILAKDLYTSVDVDKAMTLWTRYSQLAKASKGAEADAAWKVSREILKKLQGIETNNGQAIQALAKWSRSTPEGMLIQAERIINQRTFVDASGNMVDGKIGYQPNELTKWLKRHNKGAKQEIELPDEFVKKFLDTAEELQGISDMDSREAKDLMSQLGKLVNEQIPVKLPEKVTAFLMDNMLGNFRTLVSRNAGGNIPLNILEQAKKPLAALIDSAIARKTGKRTVANLSAEGLSEYSKGFGKGLADEFADMKKGLHTARSGENTLENAISNNRHVFSNKVSDYLDGLVKNGLSIGDRPFYEATYAQTLAEYKQLRKRGLMGEIVQGLSDSEFDEYAKCAARMNALGAVYQNDTVLSKGMLEMKNAVGNISEGIFGVDILSQFSMPFVKTPANVITRTIEYSPFGVLKNSASTIKELRNGGLDQARFSDETARNIFGTGIYGLGGYLGYKGIVSGELSDNPMERDAQKRAGVQEYALNTGDKYRELGWLPVIGPGLQASAAAYYSVQDELDKKRIAEENGEDTSDFSTAKALGTGLTKGASKLTEESLFQGMNRLFGGTNPYNTDQSLVQNIGSTITSGLGQGVPSLLRQGVAAADEYERDYKTKGKYDNMKYIQAGTPLRGNLQPKVGADGEFVLQNQGRNTASKIAENMILPYKVTESNSDPLDEIAKTISETTHEEYAYRPTTGYKDIEAISPSPETVTEYEQVAGRATTEIGNMLINMEGFSSLSPANQQNALKAVYAAAKNNAIKQYVTEKELTDTISKTYAEKGASEAAKLALDNAIISNMDIEVSANEKMRNILNERGEEGVAQYNKLKSEADADGNGSISGKEAVTYLKKTDYPADTKGYLLYRRSLIPMEKTVKGKKQKSDYAKYVEKGDFAMVWNMYAKNH